MIVKVKKTNPEAVIPFKKYEDDFCYDCVALSCEELAPNVYKYRLGLAFQIDRDTENPFAYKLQMGSSKCFSQAYEAWQLSIDLRPRSSVWEHGMVLSNSEATIDEGFNAEVSAVFYHVLPKMPKYEPGDRVCQAKLGFTLPMEFVEVDELNPTERADNSYGSTGR